MPQPRTLNPAKLPTEGGDKTDIFKHTVSQMYLAPMGVL